MVRNKPLYITDKQRKLHRGQIRFFLEYNVVEFVFKRRIFPPKPRRLNFGKPTPIRRIVCTSNWDFLKKNSKVFNFKTPRGPKRPEHWYRKKNLVIVYDLIIQNFRSVSLDDYRIMNSYPIDTELDREKFIDKYTSMYKRKGKNNLIRLFHK
jgi:hypothetical protein